MQQDEFAAASVLKKEGKLDSDAAALHALGVIHTQRGEPARAVALIGRAVALRPNIPAFHVNLGEAYRTLGDWDRAVGCCRTALHLWPDFPEGLSTLGLTLHGMGRHAEAVAPFRRALALRPDLAPAHNNLGIVLQELGQLDEAIHHFQRAVAIDPTMNRARTNLGLALLNQGRTEDALPHFEEAVRVEPNLTILHHNRGNALRILDRIVEARAAYLEALRLDPDFALAHLHIGLTLRREGHLADALPWFKQAVGLEPNNPFFWEQLAELQGEREEPSEAVACWERALALSPTERAATHVGLGWALQDEGRVSEAKTHYLTAARLQPDLAAAQLNLGVIHEELGERAEAEAAFREALRLQPNFALPHARLATLLRDQLPDSDRAALEQRLADPELGQGPRARLWFALAHVLDANGDYTRAADCLRQANALTLALALGDRKYAPAEHDRFVEGLIRVFDADHFVRTAGAGLETRRPVFVFGFPRSGTTLVEQVLASHPRIHGAGELRLARQSFDAIPAGLNVSGSPLDHVPRLDRAGIQHLAQQHLDKLQALDDGRAERVVDKMPDNSLYLGLLATMFPNAVFIHCRRDLRDVAVSCWMTDFRTIHWANDPEHLVSRLRAYRRLMAHWGTVLPVTVHEVDYEETVADLEGVARRLLTACGQEWDPACLEFHRTRRTIRTASVTQVRQPIYQRSVARWKNYESELAAIFRMLFT